MEPFRTEWRIAADDIGVAGSVDFVGKFSDGTYALIDWKRTKNLQSNLTNGFNRRAKYVFDEHIPLLRRTFQTAYNCHQSKCPISTIESF